MDDFQTKVGTKRRQKEKTRHREIQGKHGVIYAGRDSLMKQVDAEEGWEKDKDRKYKSELDA